MGRDSALLPPGQPVPSPQLWGPVNTASTREILPSTNLNISVLSINTTWRRVSTIGTWASSYPVMKE